MCRGVRGATTTPDNTAAAVIAATRELLRQMIAVNGIQPEDIASIIFTASPDLNAAYPAAAAREMGWTDVATLCAQEIDVPGGLSRAVRILIHWNTAIPASAIQHVYINGAEVLRPDRAGRGQIR
jgi:chorismate mutase